MKASSRSTAVALSAWSFAIVLAAGASTAAFAEDFHLKLSGAQEVPHVTTSGSAEGTISIAADGAVSGSVTASGFTPTAAHIHEGPPGTVGKVIVPFTKEGDKFVAPAGAKLTAEQMAALKAGNLYFNVHSAAHPVGEVRAVLKP
ncbi:MAG: CHRD domain-containing protein [Betaproteobacteria bacterium]|nr:CHRD domain-containing protein [Betaproteobacteria bacterium]